VGTTFYVSLPEAASRIAPRDLLDVVGSGEARP